MKDKIITPSCNFDCEMIVGLDVTLENNEIIKIHDESIGLRFDYKYHFVSIYDFKNADGQSIGEFLLDKHMDFAYALLKKEQNHLKEF
jgi:hypothetical protein